MKNKLLLILNILVILFCGTMLTLKFCQIYGATKDNKELLSRVEQQLEASKFLS